MKRIISLLMILVILSTASVTANAEVGTNATYVEQTQVMLQQKGNLYYEASDDFDYKINNNVITATKVSPGVYRGEKMLTDKLGNNTNFFSKCQSGEYMRLTELNIDLNKNKDEACKDLDMLKEKYGLSPEVHRDVTLLLDNPEIKTVKIYTPTMLAANSTTNYYTGYANQKYRDELVVVESASETKKVKRGTEITVGVLKELLTIYETWMGGYGSLAKSTGESIYNIFNILNSTTFTPVTSSLWEARLYMTKTTKYTAIKWSYDQYQVQLISDTGDYYFKHTLICPGTKLVEKTANSKTVYYKAKDYDNADKIAYERRTMTTPFREVLPSVKLEGIPFEL